MRACQAVLCRRSDGNLLILNRSQFNRFLIFRDRKDIRKHRHSPVILPGQLLDPIGIIGQCAQTVICLYAPAVRPQAKPYAVPELSAIRITGMRAIGGRSAVIAVGIRHKHMAFTCGQRSDAESYSCHGFLGVRVDLADREIPAFHKVGHRILPLRFIHNLAMTGDRKSLFIYPSVVLSPSHISFRRLRLNQPIGTIRKQIRRRFRTALIIRVHHMDNFPRLIYMPGYRNFLPAFIVNGNFHVF